MEKIEIYKIKDEAIYFKIDSQHMLLRQEYKLNMSEKNKFISVVSYYIKHIKVNGIYKLEHVKTIEEDLKQFSKCLNTLKPGITYKEMNKDTFLIKLYQNDLIESNPHIDKLIKEKRIDNDDYRSSLIEKLSSFDYEKVKIHKLEKINKILNL
jgi:hypothetical protein